MLAIEKRFRRLALTAISHFLSEAVRDVRGEGEGGMGHGENLVKYTLHPNVRTMHRNDSMHADRPNKPMPCYQSSL